MKKIKELFNICIKSGMLCGVKLGTGGIFSTPNRMIKGGDLVTCFHGTVEGVMPVWGPNPCSFHDPNRSFCMIIDPMSVVRKLGYFDSSHHMVLSFLFLWKWMKIKFMRIDVYYIKINVFSTHI